MVREERVMASFKQVPGSLETRLYASRMSAGDTVHDATQRNIADLNEHVDVIGHPTVGMETGGKSIQCITHEVVERDSISSAEENRLLMVAT